MDPILLVDDEKDNLEALRRLLRNQYDVTTTDSPFEALKLIQKNSYHVIISDQRMPEMTGVVLLEKAKAICPNSTRILLTGYTDIESVIDAINRGNVYRYVAKPWDPEDLSLTVRQANEACQLKKELEQKNLALTRSNEELKKALSELQVLDKSKARFLSLVSHELNTPLTVLSSFISLISEKQDKLPTEIQKTIASIAKASDRFGEIVSEVITFVRMESETKLSFGRVDLEKLTVENVTNLEEERRRKQVSFHLGSVANSVVIADREKLSLAFSCLLKDAVLRSKTGGEIAIDISRKPGEIVYSLSRGGEALSSGAFSPLETAGELMHHQQNLGLSLAVCRLVVERHKGKMTLDESSEKQTRISIHFPIDQVQ